MKRFRFYYDYDNTFCQALKEQNVKFPLRIEKDTNFVNVRNVDLRSLPEEVDGVPLLIDDNENLLYKGTSTVADFLESNKEIESISLRSSNMTSQEHFIERYRDYPLPQVDYDSKITITSNDMEMLNSNSDLKKKSEGEIKKLAEKLFNKPV